MFRVFFLIFCHFLFQFCSCGPAQKFYDNVVNNPLVYNRFIAPFDDGNRLTVTLEAFYILLLEVQQNEQLVSFLAQFNMTWHDPRLEFNATEYGDYRVIMPSETVWIPLVDVKNGKNNKDIKEEMQKSQVEVRSNGYVTQLSITKMETICYMEVEAFPFDYQWCNIGFSPSLAAADQLLLITKESIKHKRGIPEWDIGESVAINNSFRQVGRAYSVAEISVQLKRNPQFYIYFLIIPTFVTAFICITVLLLPVDIALGEKINVGIAGLLGLTFLLSIIVVELPRTPKLPYMGTWIISEMFLCLGAMLFPISLSIVNCCSKMPCRRKVGGLPIAPTIPINSKKRRCCPKRICSYVVFIVFSVGNIIFTVLIYSIPPEPHGPLDP